MTSREIAELTGKRHCDVMRDIKVLISQDAIGVRNFALSSYTSPQNKEIPEYSLDFKATMTLVTGYDANRRAAVIDRWMKLETGEVAPACAAAFSVPKTLGEALRLAADLSDKVKMLEETVG